MEYLLTGVGLAILLFAGDALVKGAVNLSLRLGIPALIVSLTVVAFGTSAPELLIAISAVLEDAPGIAVGNVVGSNTANVLLVLGLPALIAGLHTSHFEARSNYIFMVFASVLFVAGAFFGPITWVHGVVYLSLLAVFLGNAMREALAHREELELVAPEGADPKMSRRMITFYLLVGIIGLPLGAELLVEGSVDIARELGVRESVIGLTLIAVGTSLPELATSVVAALRRNADIAIGNVIGSNLFNVLAIAGAASLFGPMPVDRGILEFDIWVMLGSTLLLAPFIFLRKDIGRLLGALLVALYACYVVSILA